MHPKAAYLVLHGAECLQYSDRNVIDPQLSPRIRYTGAGGTYMFAFTNIGWVNWMAWKGWASWKPLDWADVPDNIWEALSDHVINVLLQSDESK